MFGGIVERNKKSIGNGGLIVGNRKFQIWSEGYSVTGQYQKAIYHGEFEAETFEQACDKWIETLDEYSKQCYTPSKDGSRPMLWGCRLFDNETDARKSFG